MFNVYYVLLLQHLHYLAVSGANDVQTLLKAVQTYAVDIVNLNLAVLSGGDAVDAGCRLLACLDGTDGLRNRRP